MKRKLTKAIGVIVVLSLLFCVFAGCSNTETKYEKVSEVEINTEKQQEEQKYEVPDGVNPLTGKLNLAESAQDTKPIAIMVANNSEVRPQWGLATPDLTVEGLIAEETMGMMWVFADYTKIPKQVGPIAPSNSYFADMAKNMSAIFVHWDGETGESKENINGSQYQNTYFFWDSTKSAEYEYQRATSNSLIQSAIKQIGYSTALETRDFAPYQVAVEGGKLPHTDEKYSGYCSSITIEFTQNIVYNFQYDKASGLYQEQINGETLVDENNNQIGYKNVVYIFVPTEMENGVAKWNYVAEGRGAYTSNGIGQRIYWKYDSETKDLKLYDFNYNPLIINPGNVWLGVVADGNTVEVV